MPIKSKRYPKTICHFWLEESQISIGKIFLFLRFSNKIVMRDDDDHVL